MATRAHEREKLERLCRYIARPAVSTKRLSLTRHGKVRYELKLPYNDGTTHVLFEPLDFISRLVKRVFKIDIETCSACGGTVKVIASIEDPAVIKKILTHLDKKAADGANFPLIMKDGRFHKNAI